MTRRDEDELLSVERTAALLGFHPRTLRTWRAVGRGPAFVRIGRRVLYRRGDLRSFVAGLRMQAEGAP